MDGEQMPKVDLKKDIPRLSTSDLHWIKQIEQENLERVQKFKSIRKKNLIVGGLLVFGVASIYTYTLHAVKQEQYFDDFEIPATVKSE